VATTALALELEGGSMAGRVLLLAEGVELVIGRESDLEIVLASDDLVSRQHARIAVAGGEATLQDLGSTNGTFLNGQKTKRAKLAVGDRIRVGSAVMRVVPASRPRTAPPPLPKGTRASTAAAGIVALPPAPPGDKPSSVEPTEKLRLTAFSHGAG
jgi:predicted component of type VI protein secretion system